MNAAEPRSADLRQFISGNEAIAQAARDAGVKVAAAYPGTPSTEILEYVSQYPDIYSEWSINEKVSLEVAIGASMAGSRALCAMKHVGMNVASDAFMTQTLVGAVGGLVIVVADDVGLSSSQNEQDSRYWGRFAHLPILEPSDAQEAYEMTRAAYGISEQFEVPVIVRLTTRICHVKGVVINSEAEAHTGTGFKKDPARFVMVPGNAKNRIPMMMARDETLKSFAADTELNRIDTGSDTRVGFVTSGAAYYHVKESFPDAPVFKLGFSHPAPIESIRSFAGDVEKLVVVEEVEPLLETELRAAGVDVYGKDLLPKIGELSPSVITPPVSKLIGEAIAESELIPTAQVFPRPPTMCVACPHLGIYYCLSHVKNTIISGDIGCYTLGAGHPWNALDTTISMGASLSVAQGLDKGRAECDENKNVLAVIGDSTFLHMGMQGLLDITYNKGNVTILLLDNRAVGMTGGQDAPSSGLNLHGEQTMQVDFRKLCEALGVKPERIHEVNPYEMPILFKALRQEVKVPEPSVIITNQPCVLTERYSKLPPLKVDADKCTGCSNCLDVGCPAILVDRRETVVKPNGKEKELAFVSIDTAACTGCNLCTKPCAPDAIIPAYNVTKIDAVEIK
ncbi:4Fe-4S dicluster domain-containing protein [Pontibacterium sp. N1Y112]|uniref:Indolepyruvate oxidoreductase subunit IorA n=1 Tax=Pontibacterium sinense TaxID=2781979 RepID=A0A8J7K6C9_9GAMM|nr:thiamine pyrophosphate-dependent enzyme [Pontibacterium sinense]MBE9396701.1 4Fe-4S dicluster domain-containing protein [Pontibacterium sinense]